MIFDANFIVQLKVDFPSADILSVGPGMHYLQESQPSMIAKLILASHGH